MKLLLLPIFFVLTAFFQNGNQTDTEKLILEIIHLNVDLKEKDYVVYNQLVDLDTSDFTSTIKEYDLNSVTPSDELILKNIDLQVITEKEIQMYERMADSINQTLSEPLEFKNKFSLISENLNKDYVEFSKPLFSIDRKYALVKFEVFNGFMFGSFSVAYLMKKENDQWIEKDIFLMTID